MSWWTGPRRVIQPILTWKDGAVDAEKMVEELHAFGCDTILQNVGGMVAWYPSTVSFHERPPQMGGDVLDTVIRTARRLQMRVLGRFDFSGLREDAYQAHPEWFFRDAQGSPMVDKGFYVTCLSSPFLEEYILPVLREVIERYPLDGAFFNMFAFRTTDRRGVFHGPCQCRACQDKYRALMGGALPARENFGKAEELTYRQFSREAFLQTLGQLESMFLKKNPEFAMLVGNGAASPSILLRGVGRTTEVELHWTPPNPKYIAPEPQPGWRYITGETCRQVRAMNGDWGSMVNLYTCGGGRLTAHSRGFVEMGLAQIVANGANPFIAFTGMPWQWDKKHEQPVKRMYSFIADHEELYSGLESCAQIALFCSSREQESGAGESHRKEFRGCYSTLVRDHREFDVIDIAQLEQPEMEMRLKKYQLLILPGIAQISAGALSVLEGFVHSGGRLLATGESGRLNERGDEVWGLCRLLGIEKVEMVRPYVENAFFLLEDEQPAFSQAKAVSLNGKMLYLRCAGGVRKLLPMTGEIEYASPELEWMAPLNGQYGLIFNTYGEGASACLPWEPGNLIYTYGQDDHISLLRYTVDALLAERQIQTDAPPQVEITLHKQAQGRLILQLVNESGQDGLEIRSPIPIRDIRLGVRISGKKEVRSLFDGDVKLQAEEKDGVLWFMLPHLETYQIITIE